MAFLGKNFRTFRGVREYESPANYDFLEYEVEFDEASSKVSMSQKFKTDYTLDVIHEMELKTLPHDMVSLALFGSLSTDQPLKALADFENKDYRGTPDKIFVHPDATVVIEIKTENRDGDALKPYKNALSVYSEALRRYMRSPYELAGIGVTKTHVRTNLDIDGDVARSVLRAFNLGLYIRDKAVAAGAKVDLNFSHNHKKVLASLDLVAETWEQDRDYLVLKETSSLFSRSEILARDLIWLSEKPRPETTYPISKFIADCGLGERVQRQTTVVNLPLFYSKAWLDHETPVFEETALGRMWRGLFANRAEVAELSEETIRIFSENNLSYSASLPKTENPYKNSFLLSFLPEDDRELFSIRGVEGKLRDSDVKKEHRHEQQTPLDWTVSTTDIDGFLRDKQERGEFFCQGIRQTTGLLKKSSDLAGADGDYVESFRRKMETEPLYNSLWNLSCVLKELAPLRSKHLSKGQVLTKRLHSGVWMAVKTTNTSSHTFFSLLIPPHCVPLTYGKLFPVPEKHNGWHVFDWVSLRGEHFSQFLGIECKLAALESLWEQLYSVSDDNLQEEVDFMTKLSALVMLEGKNQTSSQLQLLRYVYNESFRGSIAKPNPAKVLAKFTTMPRSRLCLWVLKKVVDHCLTVKPARFEEGVTSASQNLDRPIDLKSMLSYGLMPTVECCINLFYIGYLHDKEIPAGLTGDVMMLEKIVREELALRETREEVITGEEEPLELRPHEFSASWVCSAAEELRMTLASQGKTPDVLQTEIVEELCKQDYYHYATVKSSYAPDEDTRQKCVEACLKELERTQVINPHEVLHKYVAEVEARGGLKADMFRKEQIGGVREILILSIADRICVSAIETMSKVMGKYLPEELLTTPKDKTKKLENFYTEVRGQFPQGADIYSFSADMTTWCQSFVMPLFYHVIESSLTPVLRKLLRAVLNNHTKKTIRIPLSIIEAYKKNPSSRSWSETVEEFHHQWSTEKTLHDVVDFGGTFIKNRSNMLQGILHFTSSLVHAAIVRRISSVLTKLCKLALCCKPVICFRVTSDDMTMHFAIPHTTPKNQRKAFASCLPTMLEKMYSRYSIKINKVKSVFSSTQFSEFNSVFNVTNSVIRPAIKQIYASFSYDAISPYTDKMMVMSNIRRQALENGALLRTLDHLSICQGHFFYLIEDFRTGALSSMACNKLIENPIVDLGFFPLEPKGCSGIFGLDFALYAIGRNSAKFNRLQYSCTEKEKLLFDETGRSSVKVDLSEKTKKNFQAFCRRTGLDPQGIKSRVEEHPTVLFGDPVQTVEEAVLSIHNKCVSHKFYKSFSRNLLVKAASLSVASFVEPMFTFYANGEASKRSWLWLYELFVERSKSKTYLDSSLIYPYQHNYEDLYQLQRALAEEGRVTDHRIRNRTMVTTISTTDMDMGCSLLMAVKRLWFPELKSKVSLDFARLSFEQYELRYKWLRKTLAETLADCPFDSLYSLISFLKTVDQKRTTVTITGPVKPKANVVARIEEIFIHGYFPKSKWGFDEEKGPVRVTTGIDRIWLQLWRMSSCPTVRGKDHIIKDALRGYLPPLQPDRFPSMSEKSLEICLLSAAAKEELTAEVFNLGVKYLTRGFKMVFTKRQESRVKDGQVVYEGKFTIKGSWKGHKFVVLGRDNMVTRVRVESIRSFDFFSKLLAERLAEMGFDKTHVGHPAVRLQVNKGLITQSQEGARLEEGPIREDAYNATRPAVEVSATGQIRITQGKVVALSTNFKYAKPINCAETLGPLTDVLNTEAWRDNLDISPQSIHTLLLQDKIFNSLKDSLMHIFSEKGICNVKLVLPGVPLESHSTDLVEQMTGGSDEDLMSMLENMETAVFDNLTQTIESIRIDEDHIDLLDFEIDEEDVDLFKTLTDSDNSEARSYSCHWQPLIKYVEYIIDSWNKRSLIKAFLMKEIPVDCPGRARVLLSRLGFGELEDFNQAVLDD